MFTEEEKEAAIEVLNSASYTMGEKCRTFEREFAEYLVDIQNWAIQFLEIEKWPDPEEWEIQNL